MREIFRAGTGAIGQAFAHLHVRSGFSYGLGTATPEELAQAAAEMDYRSIALTDRDGLYGIPRFLRACEASSISPIAGAEITVQLGQLSKRGRKESAGGLWTPGPAGLLSGGLRFVVPTTHGLPGRPAGTGPAPLPSRASQSGV